MVADKEPLAGMVLISGVYDFAEMDQKWHTPEWPLDPATMKYIDDSAAADGTAENASARRSALPNASQFKSPMLLVAGGKIESRQGAEHPARQGAETEREAVDLILNPAGEHLILYEAWAGYVNDLHECFSAGPPTLCRENCPASGAAMSSMSAAPPNHSFKRTGLRPAA